MVTRAISGCRRWARSYAVRSVASLATYFWCGTVFLSFAIHFVFVFIWCYLCPDWVFFGLGICSSFFGVVHDSRSCFTSCEFFYVFCIAFVFYFGFVLVVLY